jgi:hypothetical protein
MVVYRELVGKFSCTVHLCSYRSSTHEHTDFKLPTDSEIRKLGPFVDDGTWLPTHPPSSIEKVLLERATLRNQKFSKDQQECKKKRSEQRNKMAKTLALPNAQ